MMTDPTDKDDNAKNAAPDKPAPTLPTEPFEDERLSLPAADPVIALRVVGTNLPEIALSPTKRLFTIGSRPSPNEVDITVSSTMLRPDSKQEHVSKVHVLLQRKGNSLWVKDQGTTNGTYFRDQREAEGGVKAGETFRIGNVTLLAMDQALLDLRPRLPRFLGLGAHEYVDRTLELIATGESLLLLGDQQCDQGLLAEEIHRTSARRGAAFVAVTSSLSTRDEQRAILSHAKGGTAFLDVTDYPSLPDFFVRSLCGDQRLVRAIVAAPNIKIASDKLGVLSVSRLRPISIPPLKERATDIPRLLDAVIARAGGTHRVSELGDGNLIRIMSYEWPRNFEELDRDAPRLNALIEHRGNVRAAGRALDVSHTTIRDTVKRLKLDLGPLKGNRVAEDDEDDDEPARS